MKTLTLTKEQKNKLLVMTRKLFTNYNKIEFGNSKLSGQYYDDDYIKFGDFDNKYQDNFNVKLKIHWIEIVLITLPDIFYKLYDTFINGTGADFEEDMYTTCVVNNKIHPVDYLYRQFLDYCSSE